MLAVTTLATLALSTTALGAAVQRRDVSYSVTGGTRVPIKDPAPVAISYEFFAFPGYVNDVGATAQCVKNLDDAAGAPTRIRIGGTTQDRATYDPSLTSAVSYTVASAGAAPLTLTYGPSFFDLAGKLSGPTTIGLNRRLNNLTNSIAAAQQAADTMGNLYAFELGNEPDLFSSSDPIAGGKTWTPSADAASQVSWQASVSRALNKTDIIQGGVFLQPPKWSVQELGPVEVSSGSLGYVKSFSDHSYPQSACGGASTNLQSLQSHSGIVSYTKGFAAEVTAANSAGKPLFFGETNSATCGGGGISPTFGAALWIVDYVLQAVLLGYERLYFHQGTIGNCQYCWWGQYDTGAPYYGAYFAASALGGMSTISQLDDGTGSIGVYAFGDTTSPSRVVVYNSAYFTSGARSYTNITLTDMIGSSATVKRLTAPYSTSRVDQGQNPTFAGQMFANATCAIEGTQVTEEVHLEGGAATFSVGASEALLIEFKAHKY